MFWCETICQVFVSREERSFRVNLLTVVSGRKCRTNQLNEFRSYSLVSLLAVRYLQCCATYVCCGQVGATVYQSDAQAVPKRGQRSYHGGVMCRAHLHCV